jgi:hypothetical protein
MKMCPVLSNIFNFFNVYNFLEYVNIIRKHNSDVFTHSKNLDIKSNIKKKWIRFLELPVLKVWVSVKIKDYAKKNWVIKNLNINRKVLESSIRLVGERISVVSFPIKPSDRDGERNESETLYSDSIRVVKRFLGSLFNVYISVLCVRRNFYSKGSRGLCLQNVNIRNGLFKACGGI